MKKLFLLLAFVGLMFSCSNESTEVEDTQLVTATLVPKIDISETARGQHCSTTKPIEGKCYEYCVTTDDLSGAVLFGTYTVTEVPCPSNDGDSANNAKNHSNISKQVYISASLKLPFIDIDKEGRLWLYTSN